MQDRLNARLMGVAPTGNGRRESYAHAPMPRMTNTFMTAGKDDPAELLSSRVKDGILRQELWRRTGRYRFGQVRLQLHRGLSRRERQDGRSDQGRDADRRRPVALTKIIGIGNDMALDEGIGVCGKGGQSVPAGVGQPTTLVERADGWRHGWMIDDDEVEVVAPPADWAEQLLHFWFVDHGFADWFKGGDAFDAAVTQALCGLARGLARTADRQFSDGPANRARRGHPVRPGAAQCLSQYRRSVCHRSSRAGDCQDGGCGCFRRQPFEGRAAISLFALRTQRKSRRPAGIGSPDQPVGRSGTC
jgi:hypothetical protein